MWRWNRRNDGWYLKFWIFNAKSFFSVVLVAFNSLHCKDSQLPSAQGFAGVLLLECLQRILANVIESLYWSVQQIHFVASQTPLDRVPRVLARVLIRVHRTSSHLNGHIHRSYSWTLVVEFCGIRIPSLAECVFSRTVWTSVTQPSVSPNGSTEKVRRSVVWFKCSWTDFEIQMPPRALSATCC